MGAVLEFHTIFEVQPVCIENAESTEISTKSSNSKGPGSCLPGPILGADDETRVFEPVAITRLQVVENISTHSFHQKSHSFAAFAKYRIILSSSFSSTLGESKFDSRAVFPYLSPANICSILLTYFSLSL